MTAAPHTRLRCVTVSGSDGVKGSRFQETFTGVDAFVGPNGSGKSTRILAVLAGLRGLATTSNDSVRDYLGPVLPLAVVDLDFDDGPRLSRQLSERRGKLHDAANGLAEGLVGPHLVRWDLADLSSAADGERTKVLQRVVDLAAGDQRVPDELRNHREFAGIRETDPAGWVKAALKHIAARFTEANAATKAAQPAPPSSPDGLTGTLADADAELRSARAALEEITTAVGLRRRAEDERAKLSATLGPDDGAEVPPLAVARAALAKTEADVRVWRAERVRLNDLRRALPEDRGVAGDVAALAAANATAADALVKARNEYQAAQRAGPTPTCRHCQGVDPLGTGAPDLALLERRGKAKKLLADEAAAKLAAAERAAKWATFTAAEAALGPDRSAELPVLEAQVHRAEQASDRQRLAAMSTLPNDRSADQPAAAARLAKAEDRREAHRTAAALEREFQIALEKREQANETFAEVKRLKEELTALEKTFLAAGFPLIAERANVVLALTDVPLRVEFRSGADFGATRDGVYIPWWSLSDGERAVVGAALGVAFAQLGKARWRAVFLDGFEAVDEDRRDGLLRALVELRRTGEIDNAIVAMRAADRPVLPEGVEVHWLGAPASALVGAA